uniref:Uncharacterized protein n=1 Tax=Cacopsylla melanoneura TaxID=428564 RepID=A0A8D8QJ91_9HEMI
MIKTNNNNVQFRNYNRKSRTRPSSLILTVNKSNNTVEVKTSPTDSVIIPRRYSENSLDTVPQNHDFLSDISLTNNDNTNKNDQNNSDKILPSKIKKDKSSQTSLDNETISEFIKERYCRETCRSEHEQKGNNNISLRQRNKSNSIQLKNNNRVSFHNNRHSDHVPDNLHQTSPPAQYEEDTAISINNILDAIDDTMINTDSDSDDEFDSLVQNYNSNPYYYVQTPNRVQLEKKIKVNSQPTFRPTNYPLMKSKSDNTILNNGDSGDICSQIKSKDDIHITLENVNIEQTDNTACHTHAKESSPEHFYNPFDIFKNNNAPLNLEIHSPQKTFRNHTHSQTPNVKHKVTQETKVKNQIEPNQSLVNQSKPFLINNNNNNYIDHSRVKVNEIDPAQEVGSKYYCRMLAGDTKTLPKTSTTASSLGTRLTVFRKSKTLTSKKDKSFSFHGYIHLGPGSPANLLQSD